MNTIRKWWVLCMMGFAFASGIMPIANASGTVDTTPYDLVKRISQEVLDAAKKDKDIQDGDRQKIAELVEKKIIPYVDFQRMTAMAVAYHWRSASPEQQQALVSQFHRLIVFTYSGALSKVRDQQIEYKPFRAEPGDTEAEVRSEVISSRGEPMQLSYRLRKEKDGWKIYDINVLGAWLIETYKNSFKAEIDKSKIDGLIKVLTTKNEKLATSFAKKSP
ncbi:MAG: transporter substrate-binding protein [Solimicrobium sp.]|jgi:phospholipid transport system substrate-binding protein|nr:transporter substrate-binding protein [Solimicrobium sp.]